MISPKSPPIRGFTGGKAPDTGGKTGVICVTGGDTGCVVVVVVPAGGTTAIDGAGASPFGPGAGIPWIVDWSEGTGSIVSLLPLGLSEFGLVYGGGGSLVF